MSTTTDKLALFKYDPSTDGAQTFNIKKALNDNWDKLDDAVKEILITLANKLSNPGSYRVFYVSKTGSDETGNGSESKPYLTIQHAVNVAPKTPCDTRIYIGPGTYDEDVVISGIYSIQISSINNNDIANVKSFYIIGCARVNLRNLKIFGVYDSYRASVMTQAVGLCSLYNVNTDVADLSESAFGGGYRFAETGSAALYGCNISNKHIAISCVASTVYLDCDTTGTGNTTALRSGDGYGCLPSIIMKGDSTISGAEVTSYGGRIW